jgi:hypothetical protein
MRGTVIKRAAHGIRRKLLIFTRTCYVEFRWCCEVLHCAVGPPLPGVVNCLTALFAASSVPLAASEPTV